MVVVIPVLRVLPLYKLCKEKTPDSKGPVGLDRPQKLLLALFLLTRHGTGRLLLQTLLIRLSKNRCGWLSWVTNGEVHRLWFTEGFLGARHNEYYTRG